MLNQKISDDGMMRREEEEEDEMGRDSDGFSQISLADIIPLTSFLGLCFCLYFRSPFDEERERGSSHCLRLPCGTPSVRQLNSATIIRHDNAVEELTIIMADQLTEEQIAELQEGAGPLLTKMYESNESKEQAIEACKAYGAKIVDSTGSKKQALLEACKAFDEDEMVSSPLLNCIIS